MMTHAQLICPPWHTSQKSDKYMAWIRCVVLAIHSRDERQYCPYCDVKKHPRWTCEKHNILVTCVGAHSTFLFPRARCNVGHGKPNWPLREQKGARLERKEAPDFSDHSTEAPATSTTAADSTAAADASTAAAPSPQSVHPVSRGSKSIIHGHLWPAAAADESPWPISRDALHWIHLVHGARSIWPQQLRAASNADHPRGASCIWAKWGRFVIFPVLCLLAFGDTALKS